MRLRATATDAAWFVTATVLVLAAVVARATFLGDRQLFRDEAASWLESSYELGTLLSVAASEPYPPLYALLLAGWMRLFGESEAALRGLSVVAGLVVVGVGWRWAHEALGRAGGLIALLFLALSPLLVSNARDARMYALETAFAALAWWLLWRVLSGRAKGAAATRLHAAALGAAVAGQLWTLAYGIPIAGLQGLVVVAALLRPGWVTGDAQEARAIRGRAAWALGALVLAGVSFLPWLPNMLRFATSGEAFWTPTPGWFDWALTFGTMIVGWRPIEQEYWQRVAWIALSLALVGLGLLLVARLAARRLLGWSLLAGAGLVVLLWAVSQSRSVYDSRYFGAAVVPVALALAAGIEGLAGAVARRAEHRAGLAATLRFVARGALVAFVGLVMLRSVDLWLEDWREDRYVAPARQLVAALRERVRPGDVLLASDARSYFPVAYLMDRAADRGDPLPAPLLTWDSGREPFYRAQSLIEEGRILRHGSVRQRGWRAALPQLAPDGRLWLLVVANGRNPDIDFEPLERGEVREVERSIVSAPTEVSQIRRLELP